MHILQIAAELAPIAKVGGLADVLLGLSRELSTKGHPVEILLPKYDCINPNEVSNFKIHSEFNSYFEGKWFPNTVWEGWVENIKVFFIEPHHPRLFFNRGCFYGCEDDIERYLFFSRACFDFIASLTIKPEIIHIHDWQAAALAPLYHEISPTKTSSKIVFSIHNMEYQGKCTPFNLDQIGLLGKKMLKKDRMQDPLSPESINLLKGPACLNRFKVLEKL